MMKYYFCFLMIALAFCACCGNKSKTPEIVKEKSLWIDASANLQTFLVKENVGKYLDKTVETGFTKIIVDVRSGSGYPMYPSKVLPEIKVMNGKAVHRNWDYLGYFIEEAHQRGLKITASIPVFVGGRQHNGEGMAYDDPAKWDGKSSVEYHPQRGMIDIRDNSSQSHVFMNPLDPDWRRIALNYFSARRIPSLIPSQRSY